MALKSFTVASIAAPPSSNSVAICSGSPAGLILLSDVVERRLRVVHAGDVLVLVSEPQPAVSAATASASPMMRFMGVRLRFGGGAAIVRARCGPDNQGTTLDLAWTPGDLLGRVDLGHDQGSVRRGRPPIDDQLERVGDVPLDREQHGAARRVVGDLVELEERRARLDPQVLGEGSSASVGSR